MKVFLFFFLIFPFSIYGQRQQPVPVNGSTDCPDFSKKKTISKVAMFQAMRSHKGPKTEYPVYRNSPVSAERPEATRNAETTSPLKKEPVQRQRPIKKVEPVEPEEEIVLSRDIPKNDAKPNKAEDSITKKDTSETEETEAIPTVKEDKKVRKKLFKNKTIHHSKKFNKRTSRKKAAKCPQF